MYIILGGKATRARRGVERGSKREREIHGGRVKARNALPQNNRRGVSLPTVTRHHALHFVNFHIRRIVRNGIPWRVAPSGPLNYLRKSRHRILHRLSRSRAGGPLRFYTPHNNINKNSGIGIIE